MTFLIGLLLKTGIPENLAKPVLYGLFAALLIGGLGIAKCSYDKSIAEQVRTEDKAAALEKARKADEAAKAAVTDTQAEIEKETKDAEESSDNCDDILKCFADELRP